MERKYNQPQQEEIKAEETKQESSRDSPAEVAEVTTPTETPVSPSTTTFPDNKETKKKDKTSFDGETTEHQLTSAILATKVREFKPLPGFDPNHDNLQYYRAQQEIDCDEVYPGIYIGDGITAKNKKYLKMLGITHLFNAAEGKRFGFVNTDNNYYADTTIKYLGLPIIDLPIEDISKYFYTAANFIDEAVSTRGKVFVHCMKGISRSATCVLAFLMIKKNMPAIDAIHLIRTSRDIRPNYGFLWQLAQLDNKLRRQRL